MTDQDSGRQPRSPRDADLDAITVSRDTEPTDRATRKILTDDTDHIDRSSGTDDEEPKGTSILEAVPLKSSPPHPADMIRPVISAEKAAATRSKPPTSAGDEARSAGPGQRDPDRVSVRSDGPGASSTPTSSPRVGPGAAGTVSDAKTARTEVSIFDIEPGESTSRPIEDTEPAAIPTEPSAFDLGPASLDELGAANEPPPTSEMPAVSIPDPDEIRLPANRLASEPEAPTIDDNAKSLDPSTDVDVDGQSADEPSPEAEAEIEPGLGAGDDADIEPALDDGAPISSTDTGVDADEDPQAADIGATPGDGERPSEPTADRSDESERIGGLDLGAEIHEADDRAQTDLLDEGDLEPSSGTADDVLDAAEDAVRDHQTLPAPVIDDTATAPVIEDTDLETTADTGAGLLIQSSDLAMDDGPALDTDVNTHGADAADATDFLTDSTDPVGDADLDTELLTDSADPVDDADLNTHGADAADATDFLTDSADPVGDADLDTEVLTDSADPVSDADFDTEVLTDDGTVPAGLEPDDDFVADDTDLLEAGPPSGAAMIPAGVDVDAATAAEQATVERDPNPGDDRAAVAAAETLEFRQIAGLTAGNIIELTEPRYDFAESTDSVGFSLTVDEQERVILVPGDRPARVDSNLVEEPVVLGSGVLDVGTARFVVRSRRGHKRAADWLDEHRASEQPAPVIAVPDVLPEPSAPSGRRRRGRKKAAAARSTLDPRTQDFIDEVRRARANVIHQQRFQHPDPSEMVIRVRQEAPVLGIRSSGHDLFAKVGVIMADMPWLPSFDDIHAIPEPVGLELQPMLYLPSVPVAADLLMGPLGIVGSRSATAACARHIMISLHALSTNDLRLHVAAGHDRDDVWAWAAPIAPERPLAIGRRLSVVIVDGMENYGSAGFEHDDAVERRIGVVVLASSVDELPSYCGTVLQVDSGDGGAVLTDHEGSLVAGTPIGMSDAMATDLTTDLVELLATRSAD